MAGPQGAGIQVITAALAYAKMGWPIFPVRADKTPYTKNGVMDATTNIDKIKEVVPWFKSSYHLRMSDRNQTEIPVSRAQTKRLRELFKL